MEHIIDSFKTASVLVFLGSHIKSSEKIKALRQRGIPTCSEDVSAKLIKEFSSSDKLLLIVEPDFQTSDSTEIVKLIGSLNPKPKISAVTKRWNHSALPFALQFVTIDHVKLNGSKLLNSLFKEIEPSEKHAVAKKDFRPPNFLIGRKTELDVLEQYLSSSGKPILLQGISGIGKRALLETAMLKIRNAQEKEQSAFEDTQVKRFKKQSSRGRKHKNTPEPKAKNKDPHKITLLPDLCFNPLLSEDAFWEF